MTTYTMKDEAKYNVRSLRKSLGFHAFSDMHAVAAIVLSRSVN